MNIFLKAAAGVLTALILCLSLNKNNRDFSVLLTVLVCGMVITAAMTALQPVINFVDKLQNYGNFDNELLGVILKVVGIGLIGEICMLICKDAGNESLGKGLQILSTAVVLWISIPVFEKLLLLLDKILGTV